MCGIFGISIREDATFSPTALQSAVNDLFRLSESRGKEAAGIALVSGGEIRVFKEAVRASALVRRPEYRGLFREMAGNGVRSRREPLRQPVTVIGHSRLVTTGEQGNRLNNQPVIHRGAVGIHNGIVVNDEALWQANPDLERRGRVDSEVIVGLIRKHLADGLDLIGAVRRTFDEIRGAASIAVVFDDLDAMVLATNTGSLYLGTPPRGDAIVFASEEYILLQLLRRRYLEPLLGACRVVQLRPGHGCVVNLRDLSIESFELIGDPPSSSVLPRAASARRVVDIIPASFNGENGHEARVAPRQAATAPTLFMPRADRLPRIPFEAIERLRRCRKCILPETMPMIAFDSDGVCNYCRHYRPNEVRGVDALREILHPLRRTDGRPDCLVGLSGGRDSTYCLHFVKTELGMNPIAFTYDWGMVTDLARRNISRICGKLGVEHILVSADIEKKRRYIRSNVRAWLKKPDLGIIPLFMAGDKQYFHHANQLKAQIGLPVIILGENMLEKTEFKTGFCGVRSGRPDDPDHVYTLGLKEKIKLATYYGMAYLRNPAYLNASTLDTLWAYACFYVIRRDYLNLYRFIRWEEDTITRTIIDAYDWETATDTDSTWRIGDGTASFYNYIYCMVAGFSENDTFRSNQIREGLLTRAQAIEMARKENEPRWESIQWYLDTIGLGDQFEPIVQRIAEIPRHYAT